MKGEHTMAGKGDTNGQDKKKQEEYLQSTWKGDYSHFEKLNPEKREELAKRYMEAMSRRQPLLGKVPAATHDLDNLLKDQAMNPLFRLGCSLRSKSGDPIGDNYKGYDDYMNTHLMEQSLKPLDSSRLQNLQNEGLTSEKLNHEVEQNIEKQVMLAKTLFLTHLGKSQLVKAGTANSTPQKEELDRPVASMMAHCSRTAYVFPPGNSTQQDKLFHSILGSDMGKGAGVNPRLAATHSVSSGPSIDDFKELKKFSMANQYGMNIAIGGAGNPGINGPNGPQTLKNDGSCGHMYMHIDKGGTNKCSSLLIGFESDSPGVTNQQGHTHNAKATPEFMSSFLGQRTDEMGDKYGGRIVDCTHIPHDKLASAVNEFTDHYRTILKEGMGNPEAGKELENINSALCGLPMSNYQLSSMMGRMGIDHEKLKESLVMPEYAIADTVPEKCIRDLSAAAPPKKPGFFTRFKASLGSADAKKMCQDHKDYQSDLAKRAEKNMVPSDNRRDNREGSLQQLVGDITNAPWRDAVPDDFKRPIGLRDLQQKADAPRIGANRTKEAAKDRTALSSPRQETKTPTPSGEKEKAASSSAHSDQKKPMPQPQKGGMKR